MPQPKNKNRERVQPEEIPEQQTITRQQFRRSQIRLAHKQIQNELLIGFFLTAVVCAVFWDTAPHQMVLTWALLAGLSIGFRSVFVSERFANRSIDQFTAWGISYVFSSMISGCIWGLLGVMAAVYGDDAQQMFALFTLTGVAVAAYTSMQSSPRTFFLFAVPAIAPLTVHLLSKGDPVQVALGVSALGFITLMLSASRGMRTLLLGAFKLSSHNTVLIRKLIAARESTESAKRSLEESNKELQKQIDERRRAEDRIRQSKERMQAIFEGMQDTIMQADRSGVIKWATPSIIQLLGYSPEEVVGRSIKDLYLDPADYEEHKRALDKAFGSLQHYEVALKHQDGTPVWVSENSVYKYDEIGSIIGYEATLRDITALKQTKDALFLEQERAYVTLGSIGDGVIAVSLEGRVEYMNIVAEQGTGWDLEEANGKPLDEVLKIVDEKTLLPVPDPVELCLDEAKSVMLPGYLLLIHRHVNQRMSIEVIASPIRNADKEIIGVVLVLHDVSELRSLAQMTYHATHDSLTGLINRREFEKRVNQALESTRDRDKRYALCYLDLDNFKVVNDTCGHVAGDELLKQLSSGLRGELREGDTLSRIGGDEFGILFAGCSIASAKRLAEKLRRLVENFRFAWEDKSFRVGVSIGLVPINEDSGTMSDILSAADSACYVAKQNGRNRIHVYQVNDSALVEQQGQMLWMQRIQEVLEHNRFRLYFQPISPIKNSPDKHEKLHGEVLLRMLDDNKRLIGPGAFIPAAERYSLMSAIDKWVVDNTLSTLAEDLDRVLEQVGVCSINLSGQSLSDERFMRYLVRAVDDTGIPPEILCFEITETAVISNLTNASNLISNLRDRGCLFALDDFGVGLSSFGYLKNLAVDYLKLDGCFIKNMAKDSIDCAMVKAINDIGQTMNIKTIAEFVENDETLDVLREIGVDYAQGYRIAKPLLLEEALYGAQKENRLRIVR